MRKKVEVNIPDIKNIEDIVIEDDEGDDEEEKKISRQIEITTPYVSVTVTTEYKGDDLKKVVKIAKHLMDKYKNHHNLNPKEGEYR